MKRYSVKVYDETLIKYLDTIPNFSDFVRQILQDIKDGNLVRPSDSIDHQIKEATLRIKKARATIEEFEAAHIDTFNKKPSPDAQRAIESRAKTETARPKILEQKELIPNFIVTDEAGGVFWSCKVQGCDFKTDKYTDDSFCKTQIKFHLLDKHHLQLYSEQIFR